MKYFICGFCDENYEMRKADPLNIRIFCIVSPDVLKGMLFLIIFLFRFSKTGAGGPMLCLVGLCFVGYRKDLTIILLCMAMGFKGAMYSGYMCSHQDLTPNYAGTLFGLTNCVATVPGFLAPLVVGIITHDNVSIPVFFVSITLDSICILPVFFVCGCVRDNYSF